MARRFLRRTTALLLPLILSGLLATRVGIAAGRTGSAGSTVDCAQLLTAVGNDPLRLGTTLFSSLPGAELNSVLTPPTQRLTLELANELAQAVVEQAAWHKDIPKLFQSMLSNFAPVLGDLAEERGLDQGLLEIVVQNFKTQDQRYDQERVTRTAQWIRQGLGFLNFAGSDNTRGASPRLKAQFISQIVIGRFGTEPWNAAGKLVDQALPVAQRDEVLKLLKEAPAAESGFFPAFDTLSGEWGMQELETGLIWFNATRSQVSLEEAIAYCKSKNQSLPSREQWQTAEINGIRNVFPEMRTLTGRSPRRFRSSTPFASIYVYHLNGINGVVGVNDLGQNRYNGVFARCVSVAAPGAKR